MIYTVSVTSQGQISIPAKVRRQLGLDKTKKATVTVENNKIIVEPIPDLMSLAGSFKMRAFKGKTIDEIIKIEKEAYGEAIIERYSRKLKRLQK